MLHRAWLPISTWLKALITASIHNSLDRPAIRVPHSRKAGSVTTRRCRQASSPSAASSILLMRPVGRSKPISDATLKNPTISLVYSVGTALDELTLAYKRTPQEKGTSQGALFVIRK